MFFCISSKKIHTDRKNRLPKNFENMTIKSYFSDKDKFTTTTHIHCFKEVGGGVSERFHFREKGIWASHTLLSEDCREF